MMNGPTNIIPAYIIVNYKPQLNKTEFWGVTYTRQKKSCDNVIIENDSDVTFQWTAVSIPHYLPRGPQASRIAR